MDVSINNVKVSAVSSALPGQELDLRTITQGMSDLEYQRIVKNTGISKVRTAWKGLNTSDLCYQAAEHLLTEMKINVESIDALLFVSQTPDQMMPATSITLAYRLGIKKTAVTLDINQGCSGYVYGLYVASLLISSGSCERVLLCVGDVITPHLNPTDHHVRMVFGDGASATLVEKGVGSIDFSLCADGSGADSLHKRDQYLYMDGKKIMEFALREVKPAYNRILEMKNWRPDSLDAVVLHQANQFMVRYLQRQLKLSIDKVPVCVEGIGNTGPASIPILLSSVYSEKIKKLKKVILCGFGVGLAWAACAVNLESTKILKPINVNNH